MQIKLFAATSVLALSLGSGIAIAHDGAALASSDAWTDGNGAVAVTRAGLSHMSLRMTNTSHAVITRLFEGAAPRQRQAAGETQDGAKNRTESRTRTHGADLPSGLQQVSLSTPVTQTSYSEREDKASVTPSAFGDESASLATIVLALIMFVALIRRRLN